MIDEVKTCVDAKVNFFGEYFSVPDQVQGDVDSFIQDTKALGEHCGSAAEFADEMKALGCDAFLTADLKYHQAQHAEEIGLNIVDAGHFETENHICTVLCGLLQKHFPDMD